MNNITNSEDADENSKNSMDTRVSGKNDIIINNKNVRDPMNSDNITNNENARVNSESSEDARILRTRS